MTHATAATPADFALWTEQAARLNVFGLHYAAEDCWEAALAAGDLGDDVAEGRYRDEGTTYRTAMRKRLAGLIHPIRATISFVPSEGQFALDGGRVRELARDGLQALVADLETNRTSVVATSMLQ